jgi:hypothetical protein
MAARRANEEDKLRFQVVSIVDGLTVNLDGLAEKLRAARMNAHGEESPVSVLPVEGAQASNGERGTNCLTERIRRARERVSRMQDLEANP